MPLTRLARAAVLGSSLGALLLLSASTSWATADGRWVQLTTAHSPSARASSVGVFDTHRSRMLLFGGAGASSVDSNEVWSLSLDCGDPDWTLVSTTGVAPGGRSCAAGIYDPAHQQLVIDGGLHFTGAGNPDMLRSDTWRLLLTSSPPAWAKLDSVISGSCTHQIGRSMCSRSSHAAAYDGVDDAMWMFGGAGCEVWLNDMQSVALTTSSATWTKVSGSASCTVVYQDEDYPEARERHSMIYDSRNHKAVVLGGFYYEEAAANCWSSSTSGGEPWTQLASPPDGSERAGHTAVYDSLRARMIVIGGAASDSTISLSLPVGGTPSWSTLHPQGTPPASGGLGAHAAVFDPNGDRMILFTTSGDTYALKFDETAPDSITTLSVKSLGNHFVYLRWTAPSDSGPRGKARCYDVRYSTSAINASNFNSATHYTTSIPNPSTYPAKDSVAVGGLTNGTYYFFAIRSTDFAGNVSGVSNSAEATPCTVNDCPELVSPPLEEGPSRADLAIAKVAPNPTRQDLRVTFSLPRSGAATLDLVDVSGRRVASVDVGALGAGEHLIDLGRGRVLPAGYYVVRLRQGDRTATRSAMVVR